MKTNRKLVRLKPTVRALVDLMLSHGDPKGFLDVKKLDAQNPDWAKPFPSREWVHMTAARLRLRGRFGQEQAAAGTHSPAEKGGQPLSAKQQIVVAIEQGYKGSDGKIDWHKALDEHPEWKREMGTVNKAQANYYALRARRKFLNQRAPLNGRMAQPPVEAPVVVPEFTDEQMHKVEKLVKKKIDEALARVINEAGCCPRCGRSVALQLREAALQSTQG